MNPVKVAEIAAERSIHPVWREVGGTFFRQGFLQGYYWGLDVSKGRAPFAFGIGLLLGLLVTYVA